MPEDTQIIDKVDFEPFSNETPIESTLNPNVKNVAVLLKSFVREKRKQQATEIANEVYKYLLENDGFLFLDLEMLVFNVLDKGYDLTKTESS